MDPNIQNLVEYSGDFKQQLLSKLYFTLEQMLSAFLPMTGVKTKTHLHKLLIGEGLKPFTGKFVSKDDIDFSPRTILPQAAQRDLTIQPSKYRDTYMASQRGKGEGANNMTIPFAEFLFTTVLNSIVSELVLQTIYWGAGMEAFVAYDAGTAYAVGSLVKYTQNGEVRYFECLVATIAGQSPDTNAAKWGWAGAKAIAKGLKAIFDDDIDAGILVPIVTGAIDSDYAYDQYTSVWRGLPEQVRLTGGLIHCGMNSRDKLNDSYEGKVAKNFETVDGVTYLAKTDRKCIIAPVPWLTGSDKLIATAPNNLVFATDELSDMNDIRTIPAMYTLDMGITFMIALNYQDPEVMAINDAA